MDDLEKYIFDPKNPQKCKVYKLLLNIVKKQHNVAYISPRFFCHIFEDKLGFIKEELWDVPDDFDELDIIDKVKLYIEQYSVVEFISHIKIEQNILKKLFSYFLDIDDDDIGSIFFKINPNTTLFDNELFFKYFNENWTEPPLSDEYLLNFIFFTGTFMLPLGLPLPMSSVMVMALEDYLSETEKNPLTNKENSILNNVHPLLLKDMKDIHILLDVLYRDMQRENRLAVPHEAEEIAYLSSLTVKNYFCIEEVRIDDLADKREIYIVGENGDGKTLFLQALLLALKGNEDIGIVSDFIKSEKGSISLQATDSNSKTHIFNPREKQDDGLVNIIAYGVTRHQNDSDKKDEFGYLTLFDSSQYLNNPTKWLQYLDYKASKGDENQLSLEVAKEMLRDVLDENVEIEVTPDKVVFNERGVPVSFDQLSDGYKNVIIWVCDLIERLSRNQPHVYQLIDFQGIVLVDEIDLHLHPKWKYQIVRKLRSWFPNIQFILTTHSPTVILGSSEDAVFYKVFKEDSKVCISRPIRSIRNLMANTVLTSPLFNLEQARAIHSEASEIDTSDSFPDSVISKEIARRIKNDKSITEDDILNMVIEELDKYESEHDQGE